MNDDGRLDLDDLGSVIERASSIDEPADVVGEEPRRTWGERLEASGISPWVRRHRVALAAGTAAVVVVGVGATAWVRAQPPPWHEADVSVVAATLDSDYGVSLRQSDDGTAVGAYLATTPDAGTTARILGVEGPGIRASSVGDPLPTGNPKAAVVRAVLGCTDDTLTAAPADYRIRVAATDAWGRTSTLLAPVPSDGWSWREVAGQRCWQQTAATRIEIDSLSVDVDEGAGALTLGLGVRSSLPGEVQATLDAFNAETAIVPTGIGTPLPAGEGTVVTGRLDVWDCTGAEPPLPSIAMPDSPTSQMRQHMAHGIGLQVFSPGRQDWTVVPVEFTPSMAADVRRGIDSVCAGAPDVRVDPVHVVRSVADPAANTMSLTVVVDLQVPPGRLAKVGITQDAILGYPDPGLSAWSIAPRGGGRAEATWTFSCDSTPTPPALDVRFVDGIRPTPVRVPLDQETLAPWVSDACPDMTADRLVESGWRLP